MADPTLADQVLSALGLGGTGTGGFAIWRQICMSKDLQEYKTEVAEKYVRHDQLDDIKADIREIKNILMERK